MAWCSCDTGTASIRRPASRTRWPGRRMCPGGIQRRGRGTGCSTQGRTAVPDGCGTVEGVDCGEDHTGACLAVGRVGGGVAAGTRGHEHRLPQLLRLDHGGTQGPQGRCAPVPVPPGPSAVDPVHPQRAFRDHRRPEAAAAEDRRGKGRVVAGAARRSVVGDDHHGRGGPVLREFRRRHYRRAAAGTRHRDRYRSGVVHIRGLLGRGDHRIPEVLPQRRTTVEDGAAKPVPQAERQQESGEGPPEGRPSTREGRRHPQRLRAPALHDTDSREPSDLRRGPVCHRVGANTVDEVGARCRVGHVHPHVGGDAARYGRTFHKIDRWFPSSQMCSTCGRIDGKKPLSVREWSCPCGAVHDRDVNTAKNILAAGRAERLNACGGAVSLPA